MVAGCESKVGARLKSLPNGLQGDLPGADMSHAAQRSRPPMM